MLKLDPSNSDIAIQICIPTFQLNFKESSTNHFMAGNKVETFLKSELKKKNALLFVLIDSEVSNLEASVNLQKMLKRLGLLQSW